jgi:ribosomal protein S27AE
MIFTNIKNYLLKLIQSKIKGDNFMKKNFSYDKKEIRVSGKPEKCPVCGFSPVATILYGDIGYSPQLSEQMEKREVVLGGCFIYSDKPRWQCSKCGTKFFKNR